MPGKKFNLVSGLCFLDMAILLYIAWIKYNAETCLSCSQQTVTPINGVYIALLGFGAALILAVLHSFTARLKIFRFLTLGLATISASSASYLQAAQLSRAINLCYYCLIAAILFYIVFCIVAFETVVKPFILSRV